jgi:hypothetical protein
LQRRYIEHHIYHNHHLRAFLRSFAPLPTLPQLSLGCERAAIRVSLSMRSVALPASYGRIIPAFQNTPSTRPGMHLRHGNVVYLTRTAQSLSPIKPGELRLGLGKSINSPPELLCVIFSTNYVRENYAKKYRSADQSDHGDT